MLVRSSGPTMPKRGKPPSSKVKPKEYWSHSELSTRFFRQSDSAGRDDYESIALIAHKTHPRWERAIQFANLKQIISTKPILNRCPDNNFPLEKEVRKFDKGSWRTFRITRLSIKKFMYDSQQYKPEESKYQILWQANWRTKNQEFV